MARIFHTELSIYLRFFEVYRTLDGVSPCPPLNDNLVVEKSAASAARSLVGWAFRLGEFLDIREEADCLLTYCKILVSQLPN